MFSKPLNSIVFYNILNADTKTIKWLKSVKRANDCQIFKQEMTFYILGLGNIT